MIRICGMLVLLLVVAAGIGYYRGWFHAESRDINGKRTLDMTVDKDKFDKDKDTARQKVEDLAHK